MKAKVLVIGGGGREHALGWKIAESPRVEKIYFAPGNGGTARLGENVSISGNQELLEFVREKGIDFTIVGPEAPLATLRGTKNGPRRVARAEKGRINPDDQNSTRKPSSYRRGFWWSVT